MQKCKKCGASWAFQKKLRSCPYCGSIQEEFMFVNNIEAAFDLIIKRHGTEVFLQGTILTGLLGDYAPSLQHERKLVRLAIECGAYEQIYRCPESQKAVVAEKYVAILTDSYFIDRYWAYAVISWCLIALGYKDIIDVTSIDQRSYSHRTDAPIAIQRKKHESTSNIQKTAHGRVKLSEDKHTNKTNNIHKSERYNKYNDTDYHQYLRDPQFIRFLSVMVFADLNVVEAIDENGDLLSVTNSSAPLNDLICVGDGSGAPGYVKSNGLRFDGEGRCLCLGTPTRLGIISNEIYPGLRFDGRVELQYFTRYNQLTQMLEKREFFSIVPEREELYEQELSSWQDIVMIRRLLGRHKWLMFGLRSNGTIVIVGDQMPLPKFKEVETWKNVVHIDAYLNVFIGVTSDGKILTCVDENVLQYSDTEYNRIQLNYHMKIAEETKNWSNIVSAIVGYRNIIALKSDGTLITAGDSDFSDNQQFNSNNSRSQWHNKCDVKKFQNIICIYRYNRIMHNGIYKNGIIGLSSSGKLLIIDAPYDLFLFTKWSSWTLFDDPLQYYEKYKKRIAENTEVRLHYDQLAYELKKINSKLSDMSGFSRLFMSGEKRKLEKRKNEIEAIFNSCNA